MTYRAFEMKILVPTDGSDAALHAAQYAIRLAGLLAPGSTSITLITVHDKMGLRSATARFGEEEVTAHVREQNESRSRAAKALLDATDIEHEVVLLRGDVAARIVDFAANGKFDLIVVGSKGRGVIRDSLHGSVIQHLLVTTSAPLLIVK
jgi:nucleotide-binding universal stress UspA family protein